MKTIQLTFLQKLRITLMLRGFVGTLGDSRTRLIRDLRSRIGLAEDELAKYVRQLGDDRLILIEDAIKAEADSSVTITAEEARTMRSLLEALPLRVVDMLGWADGLHKQLGAACE